MKQTYYKTALRSLISLSIPTILEEVLSTLLQYVDTAMVGHCLLYTSQEYSSLEEFLGATGSILDFPEATGSVLCNSTGNPLTDGNLDASIFTNSGNGVYTATVYTKVTDDYMDSVAPAPVSYTHLMHAVDAIRREMCNIRMEQHWGMRIL